MHGRRQSQCKECGGASICDHGRQRSQCKECGGQSGSTAATAIAVVIVVARRSACTVVGAHNAKSVDAVCSSVFCDVFGVAFLSFNSPHARIDDVYFSYDTCKV